MYNTQSADQAMRTPKYLLGKIGMFLFPQQNLKAGERVNREKEVRIDCINLLQGVGFGKEIKATNNSIYTVLMTQTIPKAKKQICTKHIK